MQFKKFSFLRPALAAVLGLTLTAAAMAQHSGQCGTQKRKLIELHQLLQSQ